MRYQRPRQQRGAELERTQAEQIRPAGLTVTPAQAWPVARDCDRERCIGGTGRDWPADYRHPSRYAVPRRANSGFGSYGSLSSQSRSRGGDASAGREYKDERGRSDAWRSVAGGLLRRYFRAASRLPTTRCRPASVRCNRSSAKRAASQRRIDCPQMRPFGRVPMFGAAPDGLSDPGGAEAIRMHIKTSGHACFGTKRAARQETRWLPQ